MGSRGIVDPSLELSDPCPDIHVLFVDFNAKFFGGALASCEVKWSTRMFSCAGICSYEVRGGRGGLCSIRLSKPLLSLRPRKDLIETLLHEMIHAYLFVKERNRDRDGHGPQFQAHMKRINSATGTNITIYHSFHQEVALFKNHHWRCNGPCKDRRPFFGYVKRSSNRAPGPNDLWWAQHRSTCGGEFIKVKEPEGYGQKKKKTVEPKPERQPKVTLDDFYKKVPDTKKPAQKNKTPPPIPSFPGVGQKVGTMPKKQTGIDVKDVVPFSGSGQRLGGTMTAPPPRIRAPKRTIPDDDIIVLSDSDDEQPIRNNRPSTSTTKTVQNYIPPTDYLDFDNDEIEMSFVIDDKTVLCPSCNTNVIETMINDHLDHCLG